MKRNAAPILLFLLTLGAFSLVIWLSVFRAGRDENLMESTAAAESASRSDQTMNTVQKVVESVQSQTTASMMPRPGKTASNGHLSLNFEPETEEERIALRRGSACGVARTSVRR